MCSSDLALRFLRGRIGPLPSEIGDFIDWPQIGAWIAMAIEAERHAERFRVINFVHLIDFTVAMNATDAAVYMD